MEEEDVEESFDAFEAFRKAHPEEAKSLQSVVSLARLQVLGEPQQCHCGSGKFKKVRG